MHNHGNMSAITKLKKCVVCKDEVDKGLILYSLKNSQNKKNQHNKKSNEDKSSLWTDPEAAVDSVTDFNIDS